MTRDERAARRAQRLKEDIATKSQELAQVEAQQRADARAKRDRRRQRVGILAEAAGLLIWVVSLNCCDEVLSAEYHNIRASQGMKVS